MQLGRQKVDEVDVRIEETVPDHPFDGAQDLGQLAGEQAAQQGAEQSPCHPVHHPLNDEGEPDLARARPHGLQDGDLAALLVHRHHQGGDDVEAGHRHHHQHHHVHHGAHHLDVLIEITLAAHPAADVDVVRELLGGRHRDGLRLEHVVHLEAEALHRATHAGDGLGIGQMHEAEHPIELATDLEQPHYLEGLPLRVLDAGGIAPLRQQQGDRIPYPDPQLVGDGLAEDEAVLAGLQLAQAAPRHVVARIGEIVL